MGVVYEKNHLCPECGVSFVKAYDLKVHLLKHLGKQYYSNYQLLQFFADDTEFLHPTAYNCAVCSKAFRLERNLKILMLVHNDEKSYSNCESCGKKMF